MKSAETEGIALQLLESLGLTVEHVPRETSKTPDFTATDPVNGRYVIEVKTRWDSDDFRRALASSGHAMSNVRLDRSNAAIDHLAHASEQLTARRASDVDFSLVCFVVAGTHPDMLGQQLRSTLWSSVRVVDLDAPSFSKPCFYLGKSAFHSHPDVDGVFAIHPFEGRAGLYLNAFSARRIEQSSSEPRWRELVRYSRPRRRRPRGPCCSQIRPSASSEIGCKTSRCGQVGESSVRCILWAGTWTYGYRAKTSAACSEHKRPHFWRRCWGMPDRRG
jgi:hypothetical protein